MTIDEHRKEIEKRRKHGIHILDTPTDELLANVEAVLDECTAARDVPEFAHPPPDPRDVLEQLSGDTLETEVSIGGEKATAHDLRLHEFPGAGKTSIVVRDGDVVDFTLRLPVPPSGVTERELRGALNEAAFETNPPYSHSALEAFIGSGFTPHIVPLVDTEAPVEAFAKWVIRVVNRLRSEVGFHPRFDVYVPSHEAMAEVEGPTPVLERLDEAVSIERVLVFGSYARGTALKETSDLDLLITIDAEPDDAMFIRTEIQDCLLDRADAVIGDLDDFFASLDVVVVEEDKAVSQIENQFHRLDEPNIRPSRVFNLRTGKMERVSGR